jgi:hypothetical protein
MEVKRSSQMSFMNRVSMLDEMLDRSSQEVPGSAFDLSENKPGMKLQDHEVPALVDNKDGKLARTPVDSQKPSSGKYKLAK